MFDRAWAASLLRQAADLQRERARGDTRATRRVRLLRRRFQQDETIRAIATAWGEDPAHLHREYATARREFEEALVAVVGEHQPGATPGEIRRECRRQSGYFT